MMSTRLDNRFSFSGGSVSIKRLVFALVGAACVLLVLPGVAQAKEYTLPEAHITARVLPDGSVRVTEQLTYDFSGPFSGAYREIPLDDIDSVERVRVRDLGGRPYRPGAPT